MRRAALASPSGAPWPKRRRESLPSSSSSDSDSDSEDGGGDGDGTDPVGVDTDADSGTSSETAVSSPDSGAEAADGQAAVDEEASAQQAALLFAMQIAEQVGMGAMSPTGAMAALAIFKEWYESQHPGEFPVRSWYLCKKMALGVDSKKWVVRDFCPVCDHRFPANDPSVVSCPRCRVTPASPAVSRFDAGGKSLRVAVYWSLPKLLKTLFSSPLLAKSAHWGTAHQRDDESPIRERHMSDIWDGALMQKLHYDNTDPAKEDFLYFYLSCDAVEVQKGLSPTPLTGLLLNFDPAIRGLLSSVFLFGLVPGSIKDYQAMYSPWLKQFKTYGPGTAGITVFDAHLGRERTFWLVIALCVNDLRGIPGMVNGCSGPCINGSCNRCEVKGIKGTHKNVKILPGCAGLLPRTVANDRTPLALWTQFLVFPPCTLAVLCAYSACLFVFACAGRCPGMAPRKDWGRFPGRGVGQATTTSSHPRQHSGSPAPGARGDDRETETSARLQGLVGPR